MKKKLLIGITGGIGSGKSTVSQIFEREGFNVLNADIIAKNIMQEDETIKSKIIKSFGKDSYIDGKLNTRYLAKIVFSNKVKIKKINSIVHPSMIEKINNEAVKLHEDNHLVFVEAALIFEAHMQNIFDYILMVTSNEDIRIKRLQLRDNDNIESIQKRIDSQISNKEKIGKSHFVIENNGGFEELQSKTLFFLKLFQNL